MWLLALTLTAQADPTHCAALERGGELEQARVACQACVHDGGPRAGWCADRLDHYALREDADGSLRSATELEAVRRAWRDGNHDALRVRVDALAATQGMAPTTRAEVALWLAHDDRHRRGDPTAALTQTAAVWPPAEPVPKAVADRLTLQHAALLALAGRLDEARAVEDRVRIPVGDGAVRPTPVEQIAATGQRRSWALAAAAAVGAFLVAGVPLAVRPSPRRLPLGLIPLTIALVGAWAIAEAWEAGAGGAVPWLAACWVPLHLLSARALPHAGRARPLVAAASALATVGAGYLVLWWRQDLGWLGS